MSELLSGDYVTYPIHENTPNERLTIGKLSYTGVGFWIDGPEISTAVSDPMKCTVLAHKGKKADKLFKKYSDRFDKVDIDEIGFDLYQEFGDLTYNMYVDKFKALDQQ